MEGEFIIKSTQMHEILSKVPFQFPSLFSHSMFSLYVVLGGFIDLNQMDFHVCSRKQWSCPL